MAYLYFDFRDVDKQKLHDLLPSLPIQLSARSDPYCDILSQLHLTHDRGVRKPSDRAMFECLKEMLSLEAQPPIYIILDAIDVPLPLPLSPRARGSRFPVKAGHYMARSQPICPEKKKKGTYQPLQQVLHNTKMKFVMQRIC
jgi:hypothetical protein